MAVDLKVLKNPWVIGAGVVLGVVILTMKGSGGNPTSTASSFNGLAAASIQANAQIAASQAGASAQQIVALTGYLNNSMQVQASQQVQNLQIMSGVRQSQFEQLTAYLTDLADNSARLGATYAAADVANRQTAASIDIARIQGQAATMQAHEAASASKFNSVVGGISSVLSGGLNLLSKKV